MHDPKAVRFDGDVVRDVPPDILTDGHRDDSVASLFAESSRRRRAKGARGETRGGRQTEERRSDGSGRRKKWAEEGNPSGAFQECWSDKLLSEPRRYLLPAVPAAGGAGHRAKPVLNALLNFTNLRRAVNHLGGGSTGLGCCSCRIWPGEVPAEFPRWDLPANPPFLPPIVLRITRPPLILIPRFDLFPSRSVVPPLPLSLSPACCQSPLFPSG